MKTWVLWTFTAFYMVLYLLVFLISIFSGILFADPRAATDFNVNVAVYGLTWAPAAILISIVLAWKFRVSLLWSICALLIPLIPISIFVWGSIQILNQSY